MENEEIKKEFVHQRVVTFTTDFGTNDYYVAALKGSILNKCFGAEVAAPNFVDISNTIKNYDIVHAAHTLRNAWHFFPEGSIHVVCVDSSEKKKPRYVAFEHKNHFFIGPDNGVFSLIFDDLPKKMAAKRIEGIHFSIINEALSYGVVELLKNNTLDNWGENVSNYDKKFLLKPVITKDQIRGCVLYIDSYQNIITNISRDIFDSVGKGRAFNLYFKRHEPIKQLSKYYNDVSVGETLCLFSNDLLEISIYLGKAAELHGLKVDDTVQIDFDSNS